MPHINTRANISYNIELLPVSKNFQEDLGLTEADLVSDEGVAAIEDTPILENDSLHLNSPRLLGAG